MAITLRSARINKGLTQAEAAKILGVSTDTVRNYELGRSFPDVPIIKKIERAYGMSYNELIFLPENNS